MPTRPRSRLDSEAKRRLAGRLQAAGAKVRAARTRRHWTQTDLGHRVGLSQTAISNVELGEAAGLTTLVWERLAMALDVPLRLELGRDRLERTADAGHLDIQELVLQLGRQTGRTRRFELPTRYGDPTWWTDVGLRDDTVRCLIQVECVNVLDDFGAAIRSSDRKRIDAKAMAAAIGDARQYSVHQCWVVRATRRNRELVARYPHIFATRFSGSSRAWVEALTKGGLPPSQPGLVWCDLRATKLFAWRSRDHAGTASDAA